VDDRGVERRDPETAAANARLIASAPDLLEVVKDVVHAGNHAESAGDYYTELDPHTVEAARAAIAKTEGK
jgi:hypothetical protein